MDCYRIDRNTDFLKKIGPNFRLAVLIAVVLINKKACTVKSQALDKFLIRLKGVSVPTCAYLGICTKRLV